VSGCAHVFVPVTFAIVTLPIMKHLRRLLPLPIGYILLESTVAFIILSSTVVRLCCHFLLHSTLSSYAVLYSFVSLDKK